MGVAKKLHQPIKLVQLRQKAILDYYFSGPSFTRHLFFALHPLVTAFTTFSPEQSRLIRFNAYQLQINLYTIGCIIYFGSSYRKNDVLRQEHFLDKIDIASVNTAAILGLFLLLPFVSEPICFML